MITSGNRKCDYISHCRCHRICQKDKCNAFREIRVSCTSKALEV